MPITAVMILVVTISLVAFPQQFIDSPYKGALPLLAILAVGYDIQRAIRERR